MGTTGLLAHPRLPRRRRLAREKVDKTTITKLLRVSWEAVAKIVIDVVKDTIDDTRLNELYRIGVDEVS